jgi:16S rRNA (cytosine1402-N4)-methyltransferase
MTDDNYHESVMTSEVVESLHIKKARKYIDATLGTGGHTLAIAEQGGQVLGIETDPEMLAIATKRLANIKPIPKLVLGNFVDIDKIAKENGYTEVSGIVFDLGVSNIHLKDSLRGFSFGNPEADLDMRLNHEIQGVKASDLLTILRPDQLVELFMVTLDPGSSRWLSKRVANYRQDKQIITVSDFLEICKGLKTGKKTLHEATLPFLALRIAVNSELDNLKTVLPKAYDLLAKDGKLIVITFHSREEEIVKEFFGKGDEYITPSVLEVDRNQRSRSAKMRILQKNDKQN